MKNYFKQALVHIKNGKVQEGIDLLDMCIFLSNYSPFYIYQKVKLLFNSKRYQECSDYIIANLSFLYNRCSLYIICRLIHYYEQIHSSANSLSELLTAQHLPSILTIEYKNILFHHTSHFHHLAECALIQDKLETCLDYCNLMIKLNRLTPSILYMKAQAHHLLRELFEARNTYLHCIALDEQFEPAYSNLSFVLMEQGAYREAISYLEHIYTLFPYKNCYLSYQAECFIVLKAYSKAIKCLKQLICSQPFYVQAYFDLAHIYHCKKYRFLSYWYTYLGEKYYKEKTS